MREEECRVDEITSKQDDVYIKDEEIKVFHGLSQLRILGNHQLLDILELNAEQLTYYLEEEILDNPFIELDYAIEQHVAAIEKRADKVQQENEGTSKAFQTQTLDTFIFEQIQLYRKTPIRDTMVRLVDYLDERGYLPYTYQELAKELDVPEIIVLDAMTLIKQFEPAGVGAYDLREALMLQTEQDQSAPNVAYYLLEEHFDELGEQDYTEIIEKTNLTEEDIQECMNYYHTLRPNPASLFDRQSRINLIPDLSVTVRDDEIRIHYNRQYYPKVRFNKAYYDEMASRQEPELDEFISKHRKGYQQLVNNLHLREKLILQVTQALVVFQKDFFLKKSEEFTSLLVKQIAEVVRLSEPIVNLIVTHKNLEFDDYVYTLTDFINMTTYQDRSGLSAAKIKDRIQELVEQTDHTITNDEIVDILDQEKIIISPQMVSNYRQAFE